MCDRHFGVGGDGLLLVLASNVADFRMRMFNPDGSEAEACGNGLRCLARYVLDRGLVNAKAQEILVETLAGIRKVRVHKAGDGAATIQVSMGEPKFGADDIPVVIERDKNFSPTKPILDYPITIRDRELSLSLVSIGNPHAVYFEQHPISDFPLSQLGPEVGQLAIFPNACAVAVVAQLHGYIDNKVDIKLPGGILEVEWDRVGEVFLSGPAEIVFTGEWSD